jgi:hypothetical protein
VARQLRRIPFNSKTPRGQQSLEIFAALPYCRGLITSALDQYLAAVMVSG